MDVYTQRVDLDRVHEIVGESAGKGCGQVVAIAATAVLLLAAVAAGLLAFAR